MASFFVKAAGGTGLGTSDGTAWSYAKFLTMLGTFAAGDIIQFKRGDTFTGAFTVATSGASGNPITFTAYGTGAKPIITGLDGVFSWEMTTGYPGVFESVVPSAATNLNNVVIDGIPRAMGRYPNTGWLTFESYNNTSHTITDSALTGTPSWVGAELVLRTRISVIDRLAITTHSSSTLTYSTTGQSYAPFEAGYGYFIQKHIGTLDQSLEWYYNTATSKLHVYFGGIIPSAYMVEVSTVTDLITCTNKSYIVFDNLDVRGANREGISINGGTGNIVRFCNVKLNGGDGIMAADCTNVIIEDNNIDYNTNNGIWMGNSGSTGSIIRRNTINHTGLLTGQGKNGDGTMFAIWAPGHNMSVYHNTVLNTGYTAIYIAGNNATAYENFVDTFCSVKDDGGGVYTYAVDPNTLFTGWSMLNNIVLNGIAAPEGTSARYKWAMGIYLDGFAANGTVSGNTVAHCAGTGFFANTISNNVITNNKFYGSDEQMRLTRFSVAGSLVDNTITGNQFISNHPDQLCGSFNSVLQDIDDFGTIDNNYYARPLREGTTIRKALVDANGVDLIVDTMDLTRWKALTVHDTNSASSPTVLPEYIINSVIGTNKFDNGDFASGIGNFFAYSYTTNHTFAWVEGLLEGAVKASFSSPPTNQPHLSLFYQSVGAVTSGTSYKVNFTVKGSNNNVSLAVYLRGSSEPYARVSDVRHVLITTSLEENEVVITATSSLADVHLVIECYDQNVVFGTDKVEMFQASVTFTDPDDYFLFDYNENAADKVVPLGADTWKDAAGVEYTGSVVLEQWQSIVLIKNPVITLDKTKKLADTASQAAMLALSGAIPGSWTVRTDLENTVFRLTGTVPGQISSWSEV